MNVKQVVKIYLRGGGFRPNSKNRYGTPNEPLGLAHRLASGKGRQTTQIHQTPPYPYPPIRFPEDPPSEIFFFL